MKRLDDTYLVETRKEVKRVFRYVKQTGYCSYDFETTTSMDVGAFSDSGGYITIVGISFQPGTRYVIPLGHFESVFKDDYIWILDMLNGVLQNPNIVKVAWNIKYEAKWMLKYGYSFPKGDVLDGMLLKYLMDEEKPHGLKPNVARFIPEFANYDDENKKLVQKYGWDKIPLEPLAKYCGFDCDTTLRLSLFFENRIMQDMRLYKVYRNLYVPATWVLAEAEYKGMTIDSKILDKNISIFESKMAKLEKKLKNKKVKKFELARLKSIKRGMVDEISEEIELLEDDLAEQEKGDRVYNSLLRKIQNRHVKKQRFIAGEYTTKSELKKLEPLNFNSNKQLIELLFESKKGYQLPILKYTYDKKKRQETDTPSTDADTLLTLSKKFDVPFLSTLMELKNYGKIYTSFLIGLKDKLSDHNTVHPGFLLHGTVTNRLSGASPNLQQIPRNYDPDSPNSVVKNMFVCPTDHLLIHMDYSAAELRVLAGIADETTMIQWFKEGRDFHLASACKKYNVDYAETLAIYSNEEHKDYPMWNIRRKQAKTINFGILYGQGPANLAENLGDKKMGIEVSEGEAKKFIADFHKDFPKVSKWIKSQEDNLEENGFIRMPFGTKRRLPGVWSGNFGDVSRAKRQSVNSPIQGTASNMTLFTSILIRIAIRKGLLHKSLQEVATVHDSILFYVHKNEVHNVMPILKEFSKVSNLEKYFGFRWPDDKIEMKMDFEMGRSWGDLHNYKEEEDYTVWV